MTTNCPKCGARSGDHYVGCRGSDVEHAVRALNPLTHATKLGSDALPLHERVTQIEARVAALEAMHPQLTDAELTELDRGIEDAEAGRTVDWDTIRHQYLAEAPSDEAAAIAWVREQDSEYYTKDEARHVLAALDRVTAERDDLLQRVGSYESGEGMIAARTDATPLGWVNVSQKRPTVLAVHESKEAALLYEDDYTVRTVPVYEHPPRPVAPDYQLVGACVVRPGGGITMWDAPTFGQKGAEDWALDGGGTPYRLYRGEPITEATP